MIKVYIYIKAKKVTRKLNADIVVASILLYVIVVLPNVCCLLMRRSFWDGAFFGKLSSSWY